MNELDSENALGLKTGKRKNGPNKSWVPESFIFDCSEEEKECRFGPGKQVNDIEELTQFSSVQFLS